MPQPQVHSPGKGREALRQKVLNPSFKIWYGLTVHIIRFLKKKKKKKFYRQNFSIFQNCPIKSNSSELRKFHAVCPHSPRITQNSHILLTYSILCFRHLLQQRTLENSSELCRFRTIHPHSPRITQIPHTSHYN